jgi:F-type H+-transporting ATPase subunit a
MHLTPDQMVLWQRGFIRLSATLAYTWAVMILLTVFAVFLRRHFTAAAGSRSRWRTGAEVIVETIRSQIRDICGPGADGYVPFIGTLFLFIAVSNLLDIVPGWHAPTGSLSTTAALAISVGVAVPVFGVLRQGVAGYFRHYLSPSPILLPFHLLSETSRNLALAVRLFGNIMSGAMIVGILLSIAPFFFPVFMQVLGLLTGMIQAYIFAVLATVYIAAALRGKEEA